MREENKQTENQENNNIILCYLKKFYNNKILKLIQNTISKPNTKKIFTLLLFFIFTTSLIKGVKALDMNEVSREEIIAAKSNGLIMSLCYVQDILTGRVARAVGALFILGCGWLFLIGSIKDWKPVLSLTIAVTLIFGGAELAEVISGNDFTCNTIYEMNKEKNPEPIYNEGICKIIDIDTYVTGQKWYICNSNIKEFNTAYCNEITDDTIIDSNEKDVFLVTCQIGSYKLDEKVFLRYRCNAEKEAFELISTTEEKEKGACTKACTKTQINEILTSYHAKSTLETNGENAKFEILDDSGSLKDGIYYTAGTIINLDCLSSYTEINKDGEADSNGLTAICTSVNSSAEFKIVGNCKGNCNLNNLSSQYKDTFTEWQKYNKETDLWEDTKAREFYFEDRVRIKTCNTDNGYRFDISKDPSKTPSSIIPDNEKLILKCGAGEHNSETWIVDNDGKACIKYCNITDYELYNEHIWNKDCPSAKNCEIPLTENEKIFVTGEKIGVSGCTNSNDYYLNQRGNGDKLFLKLTCSSDGEWIADNGIKCQKKCKIESIPFYNYAKEWKICQKIDDIDGLKLECENLEYNDIDNIVDGDTAQQITCQKSYGFNNEIGSTFICNDGKFVRESGNVDELCMPQCIFKLLSDFDNKSLQWRETDENGIVNSSGEVMNLEEVTEDERSEIRKYYSLKECIIGYEIVNIENERSDDITNKYTTILCNGNSQWEIKKQELKCNIKKCVFNRDTIKKDLELTSGSDNDYNILGLEHVNTWEIYSKDANGDSPNIGDKYTITENDTTRKFGYGTEIKIAECTNNDNNTYLLGDQDTILICNSDAKWELVTRSSINNTKRCKTGMCRGLPTSSMSRDDSFTLSANTKKEGNFYIPDGNEANLDLSNPNFTNTDEIYIDNGSIIDVDCVAPAMEVRFGGSCIDVNNCKVDFGGYCTDRNGCKLDKTKFNGHYYYCDAGTWKSMGSCLRGCKGGVPSGNFITASSYYIVNNSIQNSGILYNEDGETTTPTTSNVDSLYFKAGAILDAFCSSPYKEVKFNGRDCSYEDNCGGKADSFKHYYYCSEDGTWKSSGNCLKICYGSPALPTGRYLYPTNSIAKQNGTIYNENGTIIETLTASNLATAYSTAGTDIDSACNTGYKEVAFGGNCTNCENKWTSYYRCNSEGNWESRGSCFAGCLNGPTDLIANSTITGISSGAIVLDSQGNPKTFDKNNLNNVYYGNNSTLTVGCNSGYTNIGGVKYTCSNGSWVKNGSCSLLCNEASPVYDINNLKVADKMYGITFASQNNNSSMHTYNICGKNNDSSNLFTLNSNGTGLGSILPNNYVKCSHDKNNLITNYTDEGIRKLTCKQNNSINNGNCYWQVNVRSCDLNEIKNTYSDIINKQLAYGCTSSSCLKDINTIMTTNSKQIRMFAGNNWSKLYTPFKQSANEGSEVSIKIDITCNYDGTWSIVPSGYIKYEYTGGAQAFTPSKYGITSGKQLTLEVWGAQGGGGNGGKGGYTRVNYNYTNGGINIRVGGQGSRTAGGWNGGGVGGGDDNDGNRGGKCGGDVGNGGGGMTGIYINNSIIVIAGGGGGQSGGGSKGGDGGGDTGNNGGGTYKGYGGNQTSAGGSSDACANGGKGAYLQGGKGCSGGSHKWCGGGGGGGYYGGGGGDYDGDAGDSGGGGGGSGFCGNGATNCSKITGDNSGNGWAKISW